MTTKLSSKGQIVVPVSVRRRMALQSGDILDLIFEPGEGDPHLVIRRRKTKRPKMKIVTDPLTGWPVLKGPPGMPKLTSQMVKDMLADFP
jgi:AbrB family looped-hinge helix DNA binding protein